MKIEELSIGDWVRMGGDNFQIYLLALAGDVYGYRRTNNSFTGEEYYDGEIGEVRPIPLTPEILEKNGCLHTAENRILCDWFDGRITVRKYNNREWYELFVGSNQMKFKLMFVHQLQHALRLAGIDKEIEV